MGLHLGDRPSATSCFILFSIRMPDCKPQLSGWEISLLEVDQLDEDPATHPLIRYVFSNTSETGTILSQE